MSSQEFESLSPEAQAVCAPEDTETRFDQAAQGVLAFPTLDALILKKAAPEIFKGSLEEVASRLFKSNANQRVQISVEKIS